MHTTFDDGYLAVNPSYRLRLSLQLRDEFGNGEQFCAQAGEVIALRERSTVRIASFPDVAMTCLQDLLSEVISAKLVRAAGD